MSRLRLQQVKGSTSGSVLFLDNTGGITENNQKLYWDNINFKLGINTNTPAESLEIVGSQLLKGQLKLDSSVASVTSNDNKVIVDSNSNAAIHFNWDGENDIYITPDSGLNYSYVSPKEVTSETYSTSGDGITIAAYNSDFGGSMKYWIYSHDGIINGRPQLEFRDNSSVGWTTPDKATFPMILASQNTSSSSGISNSIALGGDTLDLNKSNFAFVNNLETQNGIAKYDTVRTLTLDSEFVHKKYVDDLTGTNGEYVPITGTVPATEETIFQDITVYPDGNIFMTGFESHIVGGNDGYIRVTLWDGTPWNHDGDFTPGRYLRITQGLLDIIIPGAFAQGSHWLTVGIYEIIADPQNPGDPYEFWFYAPGAQGSGTILNNTGILLGDSDLEGIAVEEVINIIPGIPVTGVIDMVAQPNTLDNFSDLSLITKKYVDDLTGTNGNTLEQTLTNGNLTGANIINHNIATGTIRQLGTGNVIEQVSASNGYLISNDNGSFAKAWVEILNTQNSYGFNNTNVTMLDGTVNFELDYTVGGVGTKDFYIVNHAQTTTNNNKGITSISSRNSILNGNLYVNSAALGGTGLTVNKSEYVFVENFEIQTGIGQYTIQPSLHGSWGDLSIPTKKYVDDVSNGITPSTTETQVAFAGTNGLIGEAEFVYDTTTNTLTVPNLVVSGTNTTINTETLTTTDPIISIGGGTNGGEPTVDDNKDRGIEFQYYTGSGTNGLAKKGFFGFDDSTSRFTFIPDGTNTNEVFSGSLGDVDINDLYANSVIFNSINNEEVITNSDSIYSLHMGSATNNYEYLFLTDNNPGNPGGVQNGLYIDEGEIDIRFTPSGWVQDSQENSSALKISTYTFNGSNLGSIDFSLRKHTSASNPNAWSNEIYIEDNTNTYTKNSLYHKQYPVLLSTNNTTVNSGVFNSVMLGGTDGLIDQDNTAFANELRFNSANNTTVISDVNSDAKIYFNSDGLDDIAIGGDASFSVPTLYVSPNEIIIAGGIADGDFEFYIDNTGGFNIMKNMFWLAGDVVADQLVSVDNRSNSYTTFNQDTRPTVISSRNTTINSGISNSVYLGGTNGTIDKSNTAFAQELRFDSNKNDIAITDINTSAGITFNNDGFNNITLQTDVNNYSLGAVDVSDGYIIMTTKDSSNEGFEISIENSNNAGVNSMYFSADDSGTNGRTFFRIGDNRSAPISTNDIDNYTMILSARNATANSGVLNSVILGGDTIYGTNSNFAYAHNLEIQKGIGQYTVQPSTNPAWGDLSIPTKKYVDDAVSYIQTGSTTNNTPLILTNALTIDTNTVVAFETIIQGVQDNGDVWAYKFDGVIKNVSGTVTLVDWSSVGLGEDVSTSGFGASVSAGTTTLDITVTGEVAKNINWKSVLTKNTINI